MDNGDPSGAFNHERTYLKNTETTFTAVVSPYRFPSGFVFALLAIFVFEVLCCPWSNHPWRNYAWISKGSTLMRKYGRGA
jgi:hypothetical protein